LTAPARGAPQDRQAVIYRYPGPTAHYCHLFFVPPELATDDGMGNALLNAVPRRCVVSSGRCVCKVGDEEPAYPSQALGIAAIGGEALSDRGFYARVHLSLEDNGGSPLLMYREMRHFTNRDHRLRMEWD
jgi:hypothetical protein